MRKSKKSRKRILPICSVMLAAALLLGACERKPEKVTSTSIGMGTVISQTIYTTGSGEIEKKIETILSELEQTALSRRTESSAVSRINASSGEPEGVTVDETVYELLKRSAELGADSEQALDITLGALVELWNIDEAATLGGDYVLPAKADIENALSRSGLEGLKLSKNAEGSCTVSLAEGVILDLGAVGKGYALDVIREYLEEQPEVKGAAVSVGGSVLVYGEKPDGNPWKVAIADPFDSESSLGSVTLPGGFCLSTSGDYERYVEVDGVRYHHILDGRTGYPAVTTVRSVTIISREGFLTDALSTACFILGPEKGTALAEKYGCEALFVLNDGSLVQTEGMSGYFTAAK